MGSFKIFDIASSGMYAELKRIEVISTNIANVNSTRTPQGGPYRRKEVVFKEVKMDDFDKALKSAEDEVAVGVEVAEIKDDPSPFIVKYDPGHPDADQNGFVKYPNINIVEEMVDLVSAGRSYEANVTVIQSIKNMISKAFEIGR